MGKVEKTVTLPELCELMIKKRKDHLNSTSLMESQLDNVYSYLKKRDDKKTDKKKKSKSSSDDDSSHGDDGSGPMDGHYSSSDDDPPKNNDKKKEKDSSSSDDELPEATTSPQNDVEKVKASLAKYLEYGAAKFDRSHVIDGCVSCTDKMCLNHYYYLLSQGVHDSKKFKFYKTPQGKFNVDKDCPECTSITPCPGCIRYWNLVEKRARSACYLCGKVQCPCSIKKEKEEANLTTFKFDKPQVKEWKPTVPVKTEWKEKTAEPEVKYEDKPLLDEDDDQCDDFAEHGPIFCTCDQPCAGFCEECFYHKGQHEDGNCPEDCECEEKCECEDNENCMCCLTFNPDGSRIDFANAQMDGGDLTVDELSSIPNAIHACRSRVIKTDQLCDQLVKMYPNFASRYERMTTDRQRRFQHLVTLPHHKLWEIERRLSDPDVDTTVVLTMYESLEGVGSVYFGNITETHIKTYAGRWVTIPVQFDPVWYMNNESIYKQSQEKYQEIIEMAAQNSDAILKRFPQSLLISFANYILVTSLRIDTPYEVINDQMLVLFGVWNPSSHWKLLMSNTLPVRFNKHAPVLFKNPPSRELVIQWLEGVHTTTGLKLDLDNWEKSVYAMYGGFFTSGTLMNKYAHSTIKDLVHTFKNSNDEIVIGDWRDCPSLLLSRVEQLALGTTTYPDLAKPTSYVIVKGRLWRSFVPYYPNQSETMNTLAAILRISAIGLVTGAVVVMIVSVVKSLCSIFGYDAQSTDKKFLAKRAVKRKAFSRNAMAISQSGTCDQVVTKIIANVYQMRVRSGLDTFGGFVTFIYGTTFITTAHAFKFPNWNGITIITDSGLEQQTVDIDKTDLILENLEGGRDLCKVTILRNLFPSQKDLRKHLPSRISAESLNENVNKIDFNEQGHVVIRSTHRLLKTPTLRSRSKHSVQDIDESLFIPNGDNSSGDCGLPYFVDVPEKIFRYIHVAGTEAGANISPIYIEDFPANAQCIEVSDPYFPKFTGLEFTRRFKEPINESGARFVGTINKTIFMPNTSKIKPSPLQLSGDHPFGEPNKIPAILRPFTRGGIRFDPLQQAMERLKDRKTPSIIKLTNEQIHECFKGVFHPSFDWSKIRDLTMHEILNGVPGSVHVKGVDRSASMSIGFAERGKTGMDVFPDENRQISICSELKEWFLQEEKMAENGIYPPLVTIGTLKDELRQKNSS
nr:MAG: hypothetical protein [Chemarfal virus 137]